MNISLALCALWVVVGVNASPVVISQDKYLAKAQMQHHYANVVNGLSQYKRKLMQKGLINSVESEESDNQINDDFAQFNEIETLQMIPIIIEQLRKNRISDEDKENLHNLFGSMWPLIEDEAKRRHHRRQKLYSFDRQYGEKIDPVLKAILRAQKFSQATDIGTMDLLSSDEIAAKLSVRNQRHIEPSQRILKMAARLIRELSLQRQSNPSLNRRSQRKHATAKANKSAAKKREMENPVVSLIRKRRSLTDADLEDLDNNQLNALNALIGNPDGDYDDYYDDASEGPRDIEDVYRVAGLTSEGEAEDAEEQLAARDEYEDYAFDVAEMLAEDDEALVRRMYGAPRRPKKNDGSIIELFKLATKHRLRQQRNDGYESDDYYN